MKRAIGELSNTVIVVIAVAILIAFFYYTVWPLIDHNFKSQTSCDKAVCDVSTKTSDGKVQCVIPCDKEGCNSVPFWCSYKG